MNRISDTAHALLPWVGIILAMQAPITAYLVDTGLPVRVVDLAIGGLALGYTAWSKHTDSTNDATRALAAAGGVGAALAQGPVQAPPAA